MWCVCVCVSAKSNAHKRHKLDVLTIFVLLPQQPIECGETISNRVTHALMFNRIIQKDGPVQWMIFDLICENEMKEEKNQTELILISRTIGIFVDGYNLIFTQP